MISNSPSTKWALSILITAITLTAVTYLFFRSQINQILGGNTDVVDTSQIQVISGALAITNVSELSADSKTMEPNQTVLIKNNKIESVGQNITIAENYHVVNGKGQFLIPGLIDSHVHVKKSKNDWLDEPLSRRKNTIAKTNLKCNFTFSYRSGESTHGY
jgi:hypothetical protein